MHAMEDDPAKLAERLYAHEKLHLLVGTRVIFKRHVTRDDFAVPAGVTGLIVEPLVIQGGQVVAAVKLDCEIPGAEPYEYEVHWPEALYEDFHQDIEPIT